MDDWAWDHVARWTEHRIHLLIGPVFCILAGATRGRGWSATATRGELRRLAAQAGVRRRFAPHQYADLSVMPTSTKRTAWRLSLAASGRHNATLLRRCRSRVSLTFTAEQAGSQRHAGIGSCTGRRRPADESFCYADQSPPHVRLSRALPRPSA